ncbi:hypothetical protein ACJJTC_005316 [Scirpophaga incertulas]
MRERAVLLNQFGSSSPRSPAGNLACAGDSWRRPDAHPSFQGRCTFAFNSVIIRSPIRADVRDNRHESKEQKQKKRRIDWAYSSTPRMVPSTPRLQGSVHPSISARRVLVYWDLESETSLLEDELVDSI